MKNLTKDMFMKAHEVRGIIDNLYDMLHDANVDFMMHKIDFVDLSDRPVICDNWDAMPDKAGIWYKGDTGKYLPDNSVWRSEYTIQELTDLIGDSYTESFMRTLSQYDIYADMIQYVKHIESGVQYAYTAVQKGAWHWDVPHDDEIIGARWVLNNCGIDYVEHAIPEKNRYGLIIL